LRISVGERRAMVTHLRNLFYAVRPQSLRAGRATEGGGADRVRRARFQSVNAATQERQSKGRLTHRITSHAR